MTDEEIASMLEHGNKSGKPGKGVSFDDESQAVVAAAAAAKTSAGSRGISTLRTASEGAAKLAKAAYW
jgi:hypothetical protein